MFSLGERGFLDSLTNLSWPVHPSILARGCWSCLSSYSPTYPIARSLLLPLAPSGDATTAETDLRARPAIANTAGSRGAPRLTRPRLLASNPKPSAPLLLDAHIQPRTLTNQKSTRSGFTTPPGDIVKHVRIHDTTPKRDHWGSHRPCTWMYG